MTKTHCGCLSAGYKTQAGTVLIAYKVFWVGRQVYFAFEAELHLSREEMERLSEKEVRPLGT